MIRLVLMPMIGCISGLELKHFTEPWPVTSNKSEALQIFHRSLSGRPSQEALDGKIKVQQGHDDLTKGISELRASAQEKIREDVKYWKELVSLTNGKETGLPLDKIKSLVTASLQRKTDREEQGLASLSKVNDASEKASMGLFEISDSARQNSRLGTRVQAPGQNRFDISRERLTRFKYGNLALSLGGGGCLAQVIEGGFLSIANHISGQNLGLGHHFFSIQSGTSGGSWTMMVETMMHGNITHNCTILDPQIGFLAPKKRMSAVLSCMGCGSLNYEECSKKLIKESQLRKLQLFGPQRGCIQDQQARERIAQIPGKCIEYAEKNRQSGVRRTCGLMNLQKGLVTAMLDPNRLEPVDIDLIYLTVEGEDLPLDNWYKPVGGEPVFTTHSHLVSSCAYYNAAKNPVIDNINLNESVGQVGEVYVNDSQWEAIISAHVEIDVEEIPGKMQVPQHVLIELATVTSLMPAACIMESIFLISSGLCRMQPESRMTAGAILQTVLQPIMEFWVASERSDLGRNILKSIAASWPKVVTQKMDLYWNDYQVGNKWVALKPAVPLHCRDKNISEWLGTNNSMSGLGDTNIGWTGQYRYYLPCVFEDESLTVKILEDLLTPNGYLEHSMRAHEDRSVYGLGVDGDAGNSDSLGLGSLLSSLSQNLMVRKNPAEPWHIVMLDARAAAGGAKYSGTYAPLSSQTGRMVERLSNLGADCSRTDQYVRNVNQIFSEDNLLTQADLTDHAISTVPNVRYGLAESTEMRFSMRQIQDSDFGDFNQLPESYQQGLKDHYFPQFVGKDGKQGKRRRNRYVAFGFDNVVDAWCIHHKGVMNAVHWICSMLMDDCSESSEVFANPLAFLDQVQTEYLIDALDDMVMTGEGITTRNTER